MNHSKYPEKCAADGGRRRWLVTVACLLTVGSLLGLSTNIAKYGAGRGLDPLTLLIWSVAGTSVMVTAIHAVTGRPPRLDRRTGEYFAVSSLVGIVAPNLLMYAAVPKVGAGFVTMSIAFPPLLTYIGALALRMERFDGFRAAGVVLALAGATYMAFLKFSRPDAPTLWIAATMLAPVILAVGNIYRTARWPTGVSPEELVSGVLLASSLVLVTVGALTDIPLRVRWHEPVDFILIAVQTGLLTAQYILYFVLQKRGGPVLMSLLGSVAAVVGVPAAIFLLGEAPPAGLAAGALLIAAGIILVVKGAPVNRQKRAPGGLRIQIQGSER